jgi:mRNA interferase HicA
LIKKIEEQGAILIRHGGKHDWYQNPATKVCQPVPRDNEINQNLARSILRKLAKS